MIRVGCAGWSYPDWDGCVYPARRERPFDALAFLSRFVDCLEVNASFYRIPAPRVAESWARRVPPPEKFRFTVKLWQGFTHGSPGDGADADRDAARDFTDFTAPLREAGLLGTVLAQYPYSFHDTPDNRSALERLLDTFAPLPMSVEVRHASWLQGGLPDRLRARGAGFCNVDQPLLSANIPPTALRTSEIGYVRLHGRNAGTWFDGTAGRDRRYDYLYTAEELAGWATRIGEIAAGAKEVFVVANNHYRGQGVANALELKARLGGAPVEAPADLLRAFPGLAGFAREAPAAAPAQGALPFR